MSLYEAAKDAVKIAQKADNIELVQKVLDVQKEALDMQEKMQRKNDEIATLRQNLKLLELEIREKGNYVLEKSVYWKTDDVDRAQPYCPTCHSKGIVLPMQKVWSGYDPRNSPWSCSDKGCSTFADPWSVCA